MTDPDKSIGRCLPESLLPNDGRGRMRRGGDPSDESPQSAENGPVDWYKAPGGPITRRGDTGHAAFPRSSTARIIVIEVANDYRV